MQRAAPVAPAEPMQPLTDEVTAMAQRLGLLPPTAVTALKAVAAFGAPAKKKSGTEPQQAELALDALAPPKFNKEQDRFQREVNLSSQNDLDPRPVAVRSTGPRLPLTSIRMRNLAVTSRPHNETIRDRMRFVDWLARQRIGPRCPDVDVDLSSGQIVMKKDIKFDRGTTDLRSD